MLANTSPSLGLRAIDHDVTGLVHDIATRPRLPEMQFSTRSRVLCLLVLSDRWRLWKKPLQAATTPGQTGSDIGMLGGVETHHFIHLMSRFTAQSLSYLATHQHHVLGL